MIGPDKIAKMMKRVFIGYKCSMLPDLVTAAGKMKSTLKNASVKWASPLYWHITSHFIGKAGNEEIEILKAILREAVSGTEPFTVNVQGIGFFPNADHPRVLWSGVSPVDKLSKLYYRTGALLRREGFETDKRPYSPHITLARIKHCNDPGVTKDIESSYKERIFGTLDINEIILYESRLSPEGAKYIPLARYPLAGHS
jgi:2'-5' RNA ligase